MKLHYGSRSYCSLCVLLKGSQKNQRTYCYMPVLTICVITACISTDLFYCTDSPTKCEKYI